MKQIDNLLRRPGFYANIDGGLELSMGFLGLGYSAFIWLRGHSSQGSIWNSAWTLILYSALLSLTIYLGGLGLRRRITYPRTGFVSYRSSKMIFSGFIALILAAIIPVALISVQRKAEGITDILILIGSFSLIGLYSYRVALAVRWKWFVAGAMAVSALFTVFLPASTLELIAGSTMPSELAEVSGAFLILSCLWGLFSLASGCISLAGYIHNAPFPRSEVE